MKSACLLIVIVLFLPSTALAGKSRTKAEAAFQPQPLEPSSSTSSTSAGASSSSCAGPIITTGPTTPSSVTARTTASSATVGGPNDHALRSVTAPHLSDDEIKRLADMAQDCGICARDGPRQFPHLPLVFRAIPPRITELGAVAFGHELGDDKICMVCRMQLDYKYCVTLKRPYDESLQE